MCSLFLGLREPGFTNVAFYLRIFVFVFAFAWDEGFVLGCLLLVAFAFSEHLIRESKVS